MSLLVDCLLLALGTVALAAVARKLGAPPLLGMVIAGVVIGALDVSSGLAGPRLEDVSSPLRLAVLIVILLRAGLGIAISDLRTSGPLGLRLAVLPLIGDVLLVAGAAVVMFDLRIFEALALGALVGAVSPAIVIPGLLTLLRRGNKRRRRVLTSLLVGAPLDNILAVVMLEIFLDAALDTALPGSSSVVGSVVDVVWQVGLGLGSGSGAGLLVGLFLRRFGGEGNWWSAIGLLAVAGLLVVAGRHLHFSYVLAVIALGGFVRAMAPKARKGLESRLLSIWKIAQYVLFGLIGAAVDLGPLTSIGFAVVSLVLLGQLGRATGSMVATARSGLNSKERLACVLAYIPKATIQAAFAALALDRGLDSGELFLVAAVVAIVITAPIGVVSLRRGVDRLLE